MGVDLFACAQRDSCIEARRGGCGSAMRHEPSPTRPDLRLTRPTTAWGRGLQGSHSLDALNLVLHVPAVEQAQGQRTRSVESLIEQQVQPPAPFSQEGPAPGGALSLFPPRPHPSLLPHV